jgi:CDP-glycerol glycerophosphotransferase (TagB/SpsB family)
VQLYHGDSDKAVTASPLNAMFDRIFVAGQAAIDRFAAHGVAIPPEKFRVVGRPQVEGLTVTEPPEPQPVITTVLYAPTWVGAHADSNYCSLSIAETIIGQLRARGLTVIFRPHPYSRRDPTSAATLHRLATRGLAVATDASLYDCMNHAHAMICDVSSVASDFLYTGKPFAITDMRGEGDRFTESFPVARAGYVIRHDAGNLGPVLDDLLDPRRDPLAATRQQVRSHYLGDFPPDRYAEAFLTAARDCLALESAA